MDLSVVSWGVSVIALVLLVYLQKKKVGFGWRVMIAMALGLAVGAFFKEKAASVGTVGTIYVNLIKMVVMPLVFASVITSITTLSDPNQLRKIGFKTIGLFLATTAIATAIGLGVGLIFDPGAGISLAKPAGYKPREIPTFDKVILDLIPANPINEMAAGKVVPVIIFAVLIAVAIIYEGSKKPEAVKPFKDLIQSFNQVIFGVTKLVIKLTPYGVFGLIVAMAAKYGLSALLPLGKMVIALYLACLIHMVFTFGGLLSLVARVNPIRFFRKAYPVMAVAFTTRSSYATLPVNLEVITKRLKVSDRIASFVAPLGATINMNGCGGIYPALVAVFVAKVYGIPMGVAEYLLLIGSATVASVGVAGVPGPASISTTVVLTSLGLPVEGIGLVLGIDAVLDMARTAVNATGTTVSSLVIGVLENEFDREAFDKDSGDELELDVA